MLYLIFSVFFIIIFGNLSYFKKLKGKYKNIL